MGVGHRHYGGIWHGAGVHTRPWSLRRLLMSHCNIPSRPVMTMGAIRMQIFIEMFFFW